MRILRLGLLPFGSHERTELVFETKGALHLVYGPNEAGKSTTRRAIVGLLYGIEERTGDAHRFPGKDLRINATVEDADGATLSVIRRKGRRSTLTDETNTPIDDALFARMLGGVGRDAYERGYGLDHELLRKGAEALLAGDADLGESLFSASTGTVNLGRFRRHLAEQADAIYSDKARKKPLSVAISAYAEKKKSARDLSMSSDSYRTQVESLADAEQQWSRDEQARDELAREKRRLEHDLELGKLFAKRRVLTTKLSALGTAPPISEEKARARAAAEETLATTTPLLHRLKKEIEELTTSADTHRAAIFDSSALAGVDSDDFQRRRGEASSQRSEIGKLEAERALALEAVARLTARLGGAPPNVTPQVLAELETTLGRLAREPARLEERVAQERMHIARISSQLSTLAADEHGASPTVDAAALRALLRETEHVVEQCSRIPTLREGLARAEDVLARLPNVPKGAAAPSLSTLSAFEKEHESLARSVSSSDSERARLREQALRVSIELSALTAELALPSEEDLEHARALRDELTAGPAFRAEALPGLRERIATADSIGDRLRRESERVSRRARLTAERDAVNEQLTEAEKAAQRGVTAQAELEKSFASLFVGIPAVPIQAGRATVEGIEKASELGATRAELTRRLNELTEKEMDAAKHLAALVGKKASSLRALAEVARERLSESEALTMLERERAERRRALEQDRTEREAALAQAMAALEKQTVAWVRATRALGLSDDAREDVAASRLSDLRELLRAADSALSAGARIDALVARVADLDIFVARLHSALDLPREDDPEARAVAVGLELRALAETRHALEKTTDLLTLRTSQRNELVAQRDTAEATLDAAVRAAGARSRDELPALEEKAKSRTLLEREILDLDLRIGETGGDPNAATEDGDLGRIETRLLAVETELERIEAELPRLHQRIGGEKKGMESFERQETMALAASVEAEHELARIADLATRWSRIVVAEMLLEERILAHRAESENDVLARASVLLRTITRGAISEIRPSYADEEKPVLVCIRPDGRETPSSGLSDGAKDALYLSLRVASLERMARTGVTLPVLLDDVLVHFDDERASGALSVIGELAKTTQVIFFTHHKRVVELAQAALSPDALSLTTLR